jgi:pyridoxine/pyridoxamine 5'-phosphate oxidase
MITCALVCAGRSPSRSIKQFARWFGEAAAAKIRDVNAMTLATRHALAFLPRASFC